MSFQIKQIDIRENLQIKTTVSEPLAIFSSRTLIISLLKH